MATFNVKELNLSLKLLMNHFTLHTLTDEKTLKYFVPFVLINDILEIRPCSLSLKISGF